MRRPLGVFAIAAFFAVAIFAVNGLGDAAQLVMGRFLEGGVGVAASAAVLVYLSGTGVRHSCLALRAEPSEPLPWDVGRRGHFEWWADVRAVPRWHELTLCAGLHGSVTAR